MDVGPIAENPVLLPVSLLIGFILFQWMLQLSYPLVVLLHELCHAVPAAILRKSNIVVHLGRAPYSKEIRLLNLRIKASKTAIRHGYTEYAPPPGSAFEAWFIVGIAPFVNIMITAIGVYGFFHWQLPLLIWFLVLPYWLANTRVALSSLWFKPVNLGTMENPNWAQSDLLYLIRFRKS